MSYPYPIEDFNLWQPSTARILGPYKNGTDLYLFGSAYPDTGEQMEIRAYKSTDQGATWLEQDQTHRPATYDNQYGGQESPYISTMQDGTSVIVAFLTPGGAIIEDGLGPGVDWPQHRLAFALFDMATDTWGSTSGGGPTVYDPLSMAPRRGVLYWQGNFYTGNGWGLSAMCKRSNGDYVFLCDLDAQHIEITQHIPSTVTFGNSYRRCYVIAWTGTWQDPVEVLLSSPFTERRDFFPGNLLLGDDDDIHIFGLSIGYVEDFGTQPDGDPYQSPPGDQISAYALHQTMNMSGVLSAVNVISLDLQYGNQDHVLREAVRAGDTLYCAYHKQNGYLAVSSYPIGGVPVWTETEVVEIDIYEFTGGGSILWLESALAVAGSTPYLFWVQNLFGPWSLFMSRYVSGAWTGTQAPETPESVFSSPTLFGEVLTARAITGAIGLTWWTNEWQYWQMSIAAAGGARGRYYGV